MDAQRREPAPVPQPPPASFRQAPAHPKDPAKPVGAPGVPDHPHDEHVHVDEPGYGHGV